MRPMQGGRGNMPAHASSASAATGASRPDAPPDQSSLPSSSRVTLPHTAPHMVPQMVPRSSPVLTAPSPAVLKRGMWPTLTMDPAMTGAQGAGSSGALDEAQGERGLDLVLRVMPMQERPTCEVGAGLGGMMVSGEVVHVQAIGIGGGTWVRR